MSQIEIIDGLLTLEQVAMYLGKTRRAVRELCTANLISHIRVDRYTFRFKKEHLEEYVTRKEFRAKGVYA